MCGRRCVYAVVFWPGSFVSVWLCSAAGEAANFAPLFLPFEVSKQALLYCCSSVLVASRPAGVRNEPLPAQWLYSGAIPANLRGCLSFREEGNRI